jgi:hypothetical protein
MTGAVVRALEASGRPLGRRELNGAEGYGGQSCPVANFALPEGKCVISVCLSDGRAAFKTVEVGAKHAKATFTEEDFQQPSTASAPAGARAGGPASASPPQSNK